MSAYSTTVTLTSVSSYPTSPQFVCPFQPDYLVIRVESGTPGVYISLDGVNDHMHYKAADAFNVLLPTKASRVWLREDGAGASTALIAGFTKV